MPCIFSLRRRAIMANQTTPGFYRTVIETGAAKSIGIVALFARQSGDHMVCWFYSSCP
jgi:hypothetical protein